MFSEGRLDRRSHKGQAGWRQASKQAETTCQGNCIFRECEWECVCVCVCVCEREREREREDERMNALENWEALGGQKCR